jgi:hypothetical protein
MCFPKPPKPDPSIAAAQAEQARLEQTRIAELKEQTLRKRKGELGGYGMRSLITGGGAGYGRNFFG